MDQLSIRVPADVAQFYHEERKRRGIKGGALLAEMIQAYRCQVTGDTVSIPPCFMKIVELVAITRDTTPAKVIAEALKKSLQELLDEAAEAAKQELSEQ
ncbi:MAG: hypothetical protein ABIG32_03735 [Candidatus Uhrbacteria bacterium]